MASSGQLWWITPLQCVATIGAAVNFGGSVLQSPLIMPLFQLPQVPTHLAAQQVAKLLHESEFYFPPTNMVCTLANLALTGTCYLYKSESNVLGMDKLGEKLPFVGAAAAMSVATTAYALGIMVPRNQRMTKLSQEMRTQGEGAKGGKEEKEFKETLARWRVLNYGRATIMLANAITSMYAILI